MTNTVSTTRTSTTHKIVVTAMLSAVAFALMFIEVPIPALIPSFVKMDISDLPELLGAFALGPVYGGIICLMKNLLHILIKGTSSGGAGELCNFLLGVFLVREPQLPLMGVLEIDGVQPAFGVEVSHQSGGSAVGKQLPLQESPDPFFIHGVTPLCFLSSFAPRSGRGFVRKYPSGSSSSAGQSWRCIR